MKNKLTRNTDNQVIFQRSFLITTGLILFFLCVMVWINNEHGVVFYLIEVVFFFLAISCFYGGIRSSDEELLLESEKMQEHNRFYMFVCIVSYPLFLVLSWLWRDK